MNLFFGRSVSSLLGPWGRALLGQKLPHFEKTKLHQFGDVQGTVVGGDFADIALSGIEFFREVVRCNCRYQGVQ